MGVSLLSSSPAFLVFFSFSTFCLLGDPVLGITRHYKFDVKLHNVTRLCHTKSIVSVNGQFPGPRIVAREGDQLLIKVVNHVPNNISIHWHGIRQLRSQRGTLFWHAHISWLRATLYGPIVILPKRGVPYPFAKPYKEVPIVFGEWFNADPEAVISQALQTGGGPNVSDAYTINGLPGPLYNCSAKDTFKLKGFGNFDPNKDPAKFNLIDPVERNTVGVPSGGWVAIRFLADNPGVWFMHCHLEVHTSWGLKMAWIVLDGELPNQKLVPPPADLPKC
ncbi:laccase 17 [Hibiscus trionum]|uniref:Laccase 17 n=1 Tax=Hibiscus trionum TaxID=183268 RepID=A0A9W7IBI1_HIBTR|nr:laccase 17 [Hibiscus trionum]